MNELNRSLYRLFESTKLNNTRRRTQISRLDQRIPDSSHVLKSMWPDISVQWFDEGEPNVFLTMYLPFYIFKRSNSLRGKTAVEESSRPKLKSLKEKSFSISIAREGSQTYTGKVNCDWMKELPNPSSVQRIKVEKASRSRLKSFREFARENKLKGLEKN